MLSEEQPYRQYSTPVLYLQVSQVLVQRNRVLSQYCTPSRHKITYDGRDTQGVDDVGTCTSTTFETVVTVIASLASDQCRSFNSKLSRSPPRGGLSAGHLL